MKILIVDDSKAMRMILTRTLRQAGFDEHTVDAAANGKEALEAIQSSPPDIVLSDWNMPEMSGLELLQELKKIGSEIKFGFVTSEGSAEMKETAKQEGALFLITKPFTPDNFRETLGEHIQ